MAYRFVSSQSSEDQGLYSGSGSAIAEVRLGDLCLGVFASRGCVDKKLLTKRKIRLGLSLAATRYDVDKIYRTLLSMKRRRWDGSESRDINLLMLKS